IPHPFYVPWQQPAIPLPVKPALPCFMLFQQVPPPKQSQTGQNMRREAQCRFPTGGTPHYPNAGLSAICGSAFPSWTSSSRCQPFGVAQTHLPGNGSTHRSDPPFHGRNTTTPESTGALAFFVPVTTFRCVSTASAQTRISSSVGSSVPRSEHHPSGQPWSLARSVGVRRPTI